MANTCVAFFGIRIELGEEDIESCEARTHPLILAARKSGLKWYWANFGSPGERYLLFLGARLGLIGIENDLEAQVDSDALEGLMADTKQRLLGIGIKDLPSLFLQWYHD